MTKNKLLEYLKLFKFRYHISFICVIMGAVIFSSQPIFSLIKQLLLIYLSFNVFLYGGIYTLNDAADINSDKCHPKKKERPLASGAISIFSGFVFACIIMAIGLAIAYFYFGQRIFLMYLAFIFVNLVYTYIAKKIPYLEIFFNGLTYPMRFLLGIMLVKNDMPYFLFLAILLLAVGIASVRRVVEKRMPGWQVRKTLKYYTENKMIFFQVIEFIILIFVAIADFYNYGIWHIVIMILYFIFVFGIYFNKKFINFYKYLFLN